MLSKYYTIFCAVIFTIFASEYCNVNQENTESSRSSESTSHYYKDVNNNWEEYKRKIQVAVASYEPCSSQKCSCHNSLIAEDLSTFSSGISSRLIKDARSSGVLYQVINNRLFRQNECMFPSRCSGIEHFIFKIIDKLPNMEFVVNTRDWPQVLKGRQILPVFSFSKTKDYLDITYPAWTFWEGGPAIKLYPTGLGRFDILRKSLMAEAEKVPWSKKQETAFFRGSRTSAERDPLVKLSRKDPGLVDAQYTKNQAWKSDADTLYAPPADEVSFEGHCVYKYLFNYRGVAASFRLKHLFLCGSLVFHVGQDWIEFFYNLLKPWVHYIPVPSDASEDDLRDLILFAKSNDELVKGIADRGFEFIRDHLRLKDVLCYWKKLLIDYSKLLKYEVQRNEELIEIKK